MKGLRFHNVRNLQHRSGFSAQVRSTRGKSGVYIIKEKGEVVYIGESHTDALYKTLTRHFQKWTSETVASWLTLSGRSRGVGPTYSRSAEVAILFTNRGEAVALQGRLIKAMRPRDNIIIPEKEEAPF